MFACFANLKKGLDVRARDFGSLADWLQVPRRALTPLAQGFMNFYFFDGAWRDVAILQH